MVDKISQDAISLTQNLLDTTFTKEHVVDEIAVVILDLLNHDFPKLVQILYSIDVNENRASECFGKENEEIAKCLAELIWARQIYKAELRKKYS